MSTGAAVTGAAGISPTQWIAIAAICASALTTLANLAWASRTARIARKDTAAARRKELRQDARKEAAAVMGRIGVLLIEANPQRWALLGSADQTAERVADLKAKWEDIRPELASIGLCYPDDEARTAAVALDVALHNAVADCIRMTSRESGVVSTSFERGLGHHAAAQAAAERLAAMLRPE